MIQSLDCQGCRPLQLHRVAPCTVWRKSTITRAQRQTRDLLVGFGFVQPDAGDQSPNHPRQYNGESNPASVHLLPLWWDTYTLTQMRELTHIQQKAKCRKPREEKTPKFSAGNTLSRTSLCRKNFRPRFWASAFWSMKKKVLWKLWLSQPWEEGGHWAVQADTLRGVSINSMKLAVRIWTRLTRKYWDSL